MVLKEALPAIGGAIVKGAKVAGAAIMNADVVLLGKIGIIVGAAVLTIGLVRKFIKDKKKIYNSKEDETPVDEALGKNYNDARNQEDLHPGMEAVKEELQRGKRKKSNIKIKGKNGKKLMEKLARKAEERKLERIERYADQCLDDLLNNREEYEDTEPNWDDFTCAKRVWMYTEGCWDTR